MYRKKPIIIFLIITAILMLGWFMFKNRRDAGTGGTLIVNTDKSSYSVNERVYIQITSLDKKGKIRCDSKLDLKIFNNETLEQFNNLTITSSPTCNPEGLTNNPDYTAFFTPEKEGKYTLKISYINSRSAVESVITVGKIRSDFSITRWGPTRVMAGENKRHPMKLTILSNKEFKGQIVEIVPSNLIIVWQGLAKIDKLNDAQTLTWDIQLKPGDAKELTYEYEIPKNTNNILSLGKVKLIENGGVVFEENQLWQIITAN